MRLHRFYVGSVHDKWGELELKQKIWIHDERLLNQWLKVLRYQEGDELILFDDGTERIYKIEKIEKPHSVGLELVTEVKRNVPKKHIYLLWSLLKKDKNDWVLQKATELGVRNFVPVIAGRSEKTGFDIDRAEKIIIEASEQCGRSDIPSIREPITIIEAVEDYSDLPLFVCERSDEKQSLDVTLQIAGVMIGPEGGWAETELKLFAEKNLGHINISDFTLRAETAAITAVTKLLQ